jgi:hypothetical protein
VTSSDFKETNKSIKEIDGSFANEKRNQRRKEINCIMMKERELLDTNYKMLFQDDSGNKKDLYVSDFQKYFLSPTVCQCMTIHCIQG